MQDYVRTGSEEAAEEILTQLLLTRVKPVVGAVVRKHLPGHVPPANRERIHDPIEEITGEVCVVLTPRLRALREEKLAEQAPAERPSIRRSLTLVRRPRSSRAPSDVPSSSPSAPGHIQDLDAYVAVMARNACRDYVRRRYPARARLSNRVRWLLESSNALGIWEERGDTGTGGQRTLCGLAAWHGKNGATDLGRLASRHSSLQPDRLLRSLVPQYEHMDREELCITLFETIGSPLPLTELVDLLAVAWDVREAVVISQASSPSAETGSMGMDGRGERSMAGGLQEEIDPLSAICDPQLPVDEVVLHRESLRQIWEEMRQLPPRQCAALLLNLRDARDCGVIELLPLLGIATRSDIAAAIGITPQEINVLWYDLPLDDAAIAVRLGATPQQVINLRKTARERLKRRTAVLAAAEQGNRPRLTTVDRMYSGKE